MLYFYKIPPPPLTVPNLFTLSYLLFEASVVGPVYMTTGDGYGYRNGGYGEYILLQKVVENSVSPIMIQMRTSFSSNQAPDNTKATILRYQILSRGYYMQLSYVNYWPFVCMNYVDDFV